MHNQDRISNFAFLAVFFMFLSFSNAHFDRVEDQVHILAADHSFDFFSWTLNAAWIKLSQSSMDAPHYMNQKEQHQIVADYLQTVRNIDQTNHEIDLIYGNPKIADPATASELLRHHLIELDKQIEQISPIAEASLEMQVTSVLTDLGLTTGGQPFPWVLYHVTPLPQNLVISKREKIGAETNYVLTPIPVEEAAALENSVDNRLNVSSLVVNIGGLAAYPTMIMRTTDLVWLTNTISHEWTHLFLGQRPLGMNYTTPELRTMNETTASIAGSEIGRIVMQRFYPELVLNQSMGLDFVSATTNNLPQQPFDYRSEMHTTRIVADSLLSQGKISEAENYMEQRRLIFWENGYTIRKLNQAYFAFYGSYADTPGGAAGEDPVGPAVRALRAKSSSLKDFLDKISMMSSYSELQNALKN